MAQYEFIIRNGKSAGGGSSSKSPKASTAGLFGVSKDTAKSVQKGIAAFGIARQVAIPVARHFAVNTVSLRTGQEELQQKREYYMGWGEKALDATVSAVAIGAVTGGVGAFVSLGISATSTLINVAQRLNTIDLQQQVENVSISMANTRAGSLGDRYNASNMT